MLPVKIYAKTVLNILSSSRHPRSPVPFSTGPIFSLIFLLLMLCMWKTFLLPFTSLAKVTSWWHPCILKQCFSIPPGLSIPAFVYFMLHFYVWVLSGAFCAPWLNSNMWFCGLHAGLLSPFTDFLYIMMLETTVIKISLPESWKKITRKLNCGNLQERQTLSTNAENEYCLVSVSQRQGCKMSDKHTESEEIRREMTSWRPFAETKKRKECWMKTFWSFEN